MTEKTDYIRWACDLEAKVAPEWCRTKEDLDQIETEAWLIQARNIDNLDDVHTFWDMDEFMDWCLDRSREDFYFHNLAGYDGPFIMHALLKRGYRHFIKRVEYRNDFKPETKYQTPSSYFEGSARMFTVFTGASDVTHSNESEKVINFIDSLPLMNTSIRSLGEMLDGVEKGDETPLVEIGKTLQQTCHVRQLDDGTRKLLHGAYWTRAEALEYMNGDTLVLARAMLQFRVPECTENSVFTLAKLAYETLYTHLRYEREDGRLVTNETHRRSDGGLNIERRPFRPVHAGLPLTMPTAEDPHARTVYRQTRHRFRQSRLPGQRGAIINGCPVDFETAKDTRKFLSQVNSIVKESYKGGFNYVNPCYAKKWISGAEKLDSDRQYIGQVLDINSMYPAIYMAGGLFKTVHSLEIVPEPVTVTPEKWEEFITGMPKVVRFSHMKARVKAGYAPIAKPRSTDKLAKRIANEPVSVTYLTDEGWPYSRAEPEMQANAYAADKYSESVNYGITLTSAELKYMDKFYDIQEMSYKSVVTYDDQDDVAIAMNAMFRAHGEFWKTVKETAPKDSFERFYAKLMLNSVYGKLGQFTREYSVISYDSEDSFAQNLGGEEGGRIDAELGCAAFITARGRVQIGTTINRLGMVRFLYTDTDSIHFLGTDTEDDLEAIGVHVHDSEFGAWKRESRFTEACFIQCKTYGETTLDKHGKPHWETTTAGFTRQVPQKTFRDAADHGITIDDRRAVHVKGGIVLIDVAMTMGKNAIPLTAVRDGMEASIKRRQSNHRHFAGILTP